jgi:hypothetical protein
MSFRGDPDIVHPVRLHRRLGRRSRRDQANDRTWRLVRAVEGVIPPGVGPLGMLTEPAVRSGEMPADSYGRVESVRDFVESLLITRLATDTPCATVSKDGSAPLGQHKYTRPYYVSMTERTTRPEKGDVSRP